MKYQARSQITPTFMRNDSGLFYTKKIWIDLDNSPHVMFFKPIIEELDKRGYQVMLTARDCFQVCSLADLFNLHYKRIGRHYGKSKTLKVAGLFIRAIQMAPIVLRQKPDLALSHGSRAQMLLASVVGIPWIVICDYEHVKLLPFIRATKLIVPEVIPDTVLKNHSRLVRKYPGIKEDVYVPNFKPDSRILSGLGIPGEALVVTIRPPATEAHYHNPESEELFEAVIDFLGHNPNLHMVLLPRNEKQMILVRQMWPQWCNNGKIIIPEQVVNGLNLIWHSDLVVSGGGTMNREAAALGVPVYSIFRGKIGAVDKYLADSGRLTLLESVEDVRTKIILAPYHRPAKPEHTNRTALERIIDEVVSVLEG
ncbi:MAG: DUF354 domain-containing protein [Deltaproteobacteria bacterium]|nr:DUF354 domain-containing protein [Deltaproteobacteria bacterium]MDL1960231.1 DUF354 domain-containing protein [Deltaproteobacteria bacterium]